jgi:UDP:flavonoid glycosyltransferase YjiC (YdhE family)
VKILLVARGSQGDVYPYIGLARRLQERGHKVSIHLPYAFESYAKAAGLQYTIENDDVVGHGTSKLQFGELLKWMANVIAQQVQNIAPMVVDYDIFVASNAEFAGPTIAEYTHKPIVRTAYAPLLPSHNVFAPLTPLVKKRLFITPRVSWGIVNTFMDMACDKALNAQRVRLGLKPMKSIAEFNPTNAFNLLLYSTLIGEVDEEWPYQWRAASYCFNDALPFSEDMLGRFLRFIHADDKPVLFYSMSSIKGDMDNTIAEWLLTLCRKHGWKLLIGSGWWKVGENLPHSNDLFVLDGVIPHNLIMPHCTAIIHQGGSGSTHSCARAKRPQMVFPLIVDQHYWGQRVETLGLGPGTVKTKGLTPDKLEQKVLDLMTNPVYKENSTRIGTKLLNENGLDNAVNAIERFYKKSVKRSGKRTATVNNAKSETNNENTISNTRLAG